MAGDWIPMRLDLTTDPAVIQIAGRLGLDEYAVVGRLHALWAWASLHSTDGYLRGVTDHWIDRYLATPGIAAALADAGWLRVRSGGIEIPAFDRWLSSSAKRRLVDSRRQRHHRSCHGHVTILSRSQRDKIVTTVEERREEENKASASADACSEPAKPPASEPPCKCPPKATGSPRIDDPGVGGTQTRPSGDRAANAILGPPADAVLEYPCIGTGPPRWWLTRSQIAEWQAAYPGIDVETECRRALAWLAANPSRRKTARGMPRFLLGWLSRSVDRPRVLPGGSAPRPATKADAQDEYLRRMLSDCVPPS